MSKKKVLAVLNNIDIHLEASLQEFKGKWTSSVLYSPRTLGVILENGNFILNTIATDYPGYLLSDYIEATQPSYIKVLVDFILDNHPEIKEKFIVRKHMEIV